MATVELTDQITITFSVKHRATTAAWLSEHLGFKESLVADDIGWTELHTHTPGVVIGLGDADQPSPGNCVPVFSVANLGEARAALEAKGIRFDGDSITIDGMVRLATFFDPDDNALMLAEDLSQPA